MTTYTPLYAVLFVFVIAIVSTAVIVIKTKPSDNFETQKIRFAAALFVGILMLVLVSAVIAISGEGDKGVDVFKTIMSGLSPIAGGIIGYLFSSSEKGK
ncbi:hypothetical protein MNBD_GAMMA11-832 [hydrothermal vent metagenome]|uniref:Uncharacterized protein n=1 Tax=hydrothermal vent metagenome TaxID=652676 RepID=A0A3B0XR53_9ZZZZ